MNPLELFQLLKTDVLLAYKKHHPYFEGTWKTFSSQDILNLIDLIENKINQRVSEKWIYTHLKPEDNPKLPRKDMLDILSQLVGCSSWDEYVFKNKKGVCEEIEPIRKKPKTIIWIISGIILIGIATYSYCQFNDTESKTITIKDAFTNKKISGNEIKATVVEEATEKPIEIVNSEIKISKKRTKILLKSPYYKEKTIVINKDSQSEITLQPDDYAMMLKAFIKSDIKDWQTRKVQLQKILAEDVEVIVVLKDNLGFEYFNKVEFSEKLIVPSASLKKMRLIDIQHNAKNEINFVRIIQE
ncbi:hypothetical protein J2X31_002948 [Flavobacterium arsenatis]|uniref:DUF4974 domain-containing protein n=1 Tax=Flavobacterium arsenatis TaxID=1484332 RepID=A0ABU1TSU4_9FLAO|nr:hypothetical protein [Flavobacterium arsenatis]MDR6968922.1 hypothetical protein [Flavobacterium arsenatis]